jgi:hypothetical protein
MPKAAMYEDRPSARFVGKIRIARQRRDMRPKAQAQSVDSRARQ